MNQNIDESAQENTGMEMEVFHQMELMDIYEDGSQDWCCPTCGRRIIMHWPPNYRREVLVEGDLNAMHTGGTGGVQMSAVEIPGSMQASAQPLDDVDFHGTMIEPDDPALFVFARFLDEAGFD